MGKIYPMMPTFSKNGGKDGGLDTSQDTCEQTSRSNRLHTDIRKISQAASKVRKSLQTCGLVNNKEVLKGHIQRLVEAEVKL